jgi:hypothetical protein
VISLAKQISKFYLEKVIRFQLCLQISTPRGRLSIQGYAINYAINYAKDSSEKSLPSDDFDSLPAISFPHIQKYLSYQGPML